MWDSRSTDSGSSIMGVLFIIIVIWAIFGGGFGNFGRDNVAYAQPAATCGVTSNCQVEKQTIINTATTQNLIQTEAEKTRSQATQLYIADQAEKLFDAKLNAQTTAILNGQALAAKDSEIAQLKAERYADARYNELARGQERIACNMLQKPPVYGQSFVTCGQPIPSGC